MKITEAYIKLNKLQKKIEKLRLKIEDVKTESISLKDEKSKKIERDNISALLRKYEKSVEEEKNISNAIQVIMDSPVIQEKLNQLKASEAFLSFLKGGISEEDPEEKKYWDSCMVITGEHPEGIAIRKRYPVKKSHQKQLLEETKTKIRELEKSLYRINEESVVRI